jgi:2-amino-4-hydroxy-6-hydroxymethyldihydropteridine diphosphokinase
LRRILAGIIAGGLLVVGPVWVQNHLYGSLASLAMLVLVVLAFSILAAVWREASPVPLGWKPGRDQSVRVGIALGSNQGNSLELLKEARRRISALPAISGPVTSAAIFRTAPVNCPPESPDFLNTLIEVTLQGSPHDLPDLLQALQKIERDMDRLPPDRREVNAPRTMDCDIIYALPNADSGTQTSLILRTETLRVPHPRAHTRAFVLAPIADLRPNLYFPHLEKAAAELLVNAPDAPGVERVEDKW